MNFHCAILKNGILQISECFPFLCVLCDLGG